MIIDQVRTIASASVAPQQQYILSANDQVRTMDQMASASTVPQQATTPFIVSATNQGHSQQLNHYTIDQQTQEVSPHQMVYVQNDDGSYNLKDDVTYDGDHNINYQSLLGLLASIVEAQAKLETRVEDGFREILNKLSTMESIPRAISNPSNPAVLVDNTPASFAPLDSVEKLQEFERNLKNDEFAQNAVSL